ncbi:MAG: formylglycine-generating enzyme family protein [Proteobacteria bacterium]|nr:formylglycine-generating enzyme family protein [Pseudomonadota bacterium]
MTAKEISVFVVGILLVVFLYLMKYPTHSNTNSLSISKNYQTVGIDKIPEPANIGFDTSTNKTTIETILDIPAWTFDLNALEQRTSEELVAKITHAIAQENYFQPEQDNALFFLLTLKSIDKENPNIKEFTSTIDEHLNIQAQTAISKSDDKLLATTIAKIKTIHKNTLSIKLLETKLASIKTINKLYATGMQHIHNNQITSLDSQDAWHTAKQCMDIDSNNPKTQQLVTQVNTILINNALRAAEETDFLMANNTIQQARLLAPNSITVKHAQNQINQLKQQRYIWLEQQINQAIIQTNLIRIEKLYQQLIDLGLGSAQLSEYQTAINRIKTYGKYTPLEVFLDNSSNQNNFPTMVVMPTGSYMMGDENGANNEKPVHQITFNYGFAVSQNEISVNEFKQFITESSYKTDAETKKSSKIYDASTGRLKNKRHINWRHDYRGKRTKDTNPVIHVSWNDAVAYTKWLSGKTHKSYRLLSEAEFEYILRAGTNSKYPWGDANPIGVTENLTGKKDKSKYSARQQWQQGFENYNDKYWGPAPTGNFIPNQFKLNDTAGNVMEWVADCWHDSYIRAPIDGSSWSNPGCQSHVIRGGSWASAKNDFRSSHRFRAKSNFTDARLGFRIALDLSEK